MSQGKKTPRPDVFLTTQWTQVLAARGGTTEAGAALCELCAVYYEPVVAFLRRGGRDADQARDEAHAFFEWVLGRDALAGVDPVRGRFRSYLLGALKHFRAQAHERASRLKRGGGQPVVPLSAGDASAGDGESETEWDPVDPNALPPDREFDRQWAIHVLRRALEALERECAAENPGAAGCDGETEVRRAGVGQAMSGSLDDFAMLKPFLTGDAAHGGLAALAAEQGINEATLRARLHRLRQRFRRCVKREVEPTLAGSGEVESELAALLAALAG